MLWPYNPQKGWFFFSAVDLCNGCSQHHVVSLDFGCRLFNLVIVKCYSRTSPNISLYYRLLLHLKWENTLIWGYCCLEGLMIVSSHFSLIIFGQFVCFEQGIQPCSYQAGERGQANIRLIVNSVQQPDRTWHVSFCVSCLKACCPVFVWRLNSPRFNEFFGKWVNQWLDEAVDGWEE